jgi:hypothetical protein
MISKELLSEVLYEADSHWKIYNIETIRENEIYIELGTFDEDFNQVSINIHELAHKYCKDWAYKEEYTIMSCTFMAICESHPRESRVHPNNPKEFRADTEPEAIFKACQWILEKQVQNIDHDLMCGMAGCP